MIFHKSLNKKKGAAYSFFSGLSAGFVPAVLILLLQTFMTVGVPLIEFINTDFSTGDKKSKDLYDYFIYGETDTVTIYFILAISGILAIFTAVRLFSFICDKRTVNVFYSLGIKRSTLFLSKYCAGAVLLIASIIIPVILSYIVNLIFLGPSWRMSLTLFHFYCGLSVFSLICFSVAAVVFSSVGTVSEAVVYSVALLFAPTIIIFITENIAGALLTSSTLNVYTETFSDMSNHYRDGTSLLQATSDYNPLLFFARQLQDFSIAFIDGDKIMLRVGNEESPWHLPSLFVSVPWFVIAVALGVAGALLFRRIKAENCGFLNTNKILSNLTIFELCLVGSSIMLGEVNYTDIAIIIAAGVAAAFALYLIAEIFLKRNFIKIVKTLYKFAAHMAVIGLIFGICAADIFNYTSYIPDKSKIESVEISTPFSYSPITTKSMGYGWNSNSFIALMEPYSFYFMPKITTSEEIDKIIEINRKIVKTEKDDGLGCEIVIRYNLKNGNTSERKHILTSKEEISALFGIFDLGDVKKEISTLFYNSGGIDALKQANDRYGWVDEPVFMRLAFDYEYSEVIARTVSLQENKTLSLTKEQFTALKDAVYADLMSRSAAEYFTGNSRQLGVLSFGINEKARQIEGINGYYDAPVYEEFTEYPAPEEATTAEATGEIPLEDIFTDENLTEDILTENIFGEEIPQASPEVSVYSNTDTMPYESLGGMRRSGTYDIIVTENMINTLNFLNTNGFSDCFTSEYQIESISFRQYNSGEIFSYYSYRSNNFIHDFFAYPVAPNEFDGISADVNFDPVGVISENIITDEARIKELDSLMKLHEYSFDSGYFCLIKYKNGAYTTRYLSTEDAPQYVNSHTYTLNLNPLY